jgi:hypothetical protein
MKNKSTKINKINKLNKSKKSNKQSRQIEDNTIILNGPVNYFNLSNGNNQINIFMDFHAPISRQRKCEDYDSKDIDKYFNKILLENNIKSKSEPLDFFLEINPTSISFKHKYYSNDNYLVSIRKMFSKLYNEKYANLDEDKMPEQNIRLHYMDIRDYSSFNELKRKMEGILIELDRTRLDNLEFVIGELTSVKNILMFIDSMIISITSDNKKSIYESLSLKKIDFVNLREKLSTQNDKQNKSKQNKSNDDSKNDNNDNNDKNDNNQEIKKDKKKDTNIIDQPPLSTNMVMDVGLYQILQKILLNYKNANNQDNIITLFTEHYIKTSHYIINKLNALISNIIKIDKIIDDYIIEEKITFEEINSNKNDGSRDVLPYYFYSMDKYKKAWREIIDEIEEINHLIVKMGVIMTDCYFLRRLIDNSTIKKSIVYTGAYHSVIYLWFLIKYCNYNINDYSYLRDDITKSKLVDIIKKSDYLDIVQYVIPNKVNQCIKIKEL